MPLRRGSTEPSSRVIKLYHLSFESPTQEPFPVVSRYLSPLQEPGHKAIGSYDGKPCRLQVSVAA